MTDTTHTQPLQRQRRMPRPVDEGSALEIRPVTGRSDLRGFIRLPWQLYRSSPCWVPPLISERRRHLDRAVNPFFEHAEAAYFLAAEGWLRQRGCDRMVGPLDFSTNHECGLLVEGFEFVPQILENWHHPYYRGLLEGQGFTKAMDLYKWEILYERRPEVFPIIEDLARRLEPEHGIRLRRMRKRNLRDEVEAFRDVYNEAWAGNWGFVPLTDAELEHMVRELKPVLDEDFACVAETREGESAGIVLSLPDFNKVLARLNGRLLPLGWARALWEQRRIDEIRVFALGVKLRFQRTGVAAALYHHVWETCARRGIKRAETGWILEVNEPMNRAMEALAGRIIKRYRIYERPVSVGGELDR